jgi:hypothetical protein
VKNLWKVSFRSTGKELQKEFESEAYVLTEEDSIKELEAEVIKSAPMVTNIRFTDIKRIGTTLNG